ncbi:MAG: PKD domain-containing protein, partial [Bacteroidota bacterium]
APCIDEEFGLSADQAGSGFRYAWDFGDGTTSTQSAPRHTYANGGEFTQTLRVTSPAGCVADTSTTIFVTTPPMPLFTLDSLEGCAPYVLNVADQSVGNDFTTTWRINGETFPGGQPLNYVLDSFLTDTVFEVRLEAENFCGARAQVQSVSVKPYPTVIFGLATDDGCSPFTPSISNVSLGNPATWFWDMGNGLTGTDSLPPIQAYTTPEDSVSVYDISLVARNECGADTLTEQLTIFPPDVTAFISVDTIAGCQPWQFAPRSFSTPGAALAWEVTNASGELVTSGSGPNPSFELTELGVHRVILRAIGCGEDADTVFVDVLPAPEVSFIAPPRICQ